MFSRLMCTAALVTLPIVLPGTAAAQTDAGLRNRIADELFTFGDCGTPLCLDLTNAHGNHFIPALAEGNDAVIAFLTDAIGNATLSVPLSATSSGVTFSFVGGVPVATSTSAGPIFGERTQTLGRGRFFIGASVTGIEFKSLNGVPLDNLQLTFKHEDGDPVPALGDPIFENDVMILNLGMDVNVVVGTIAATVGLSDFVDIGVVVPLVRTQVRGRTVAQILPFGSSAVHRFGGTDSDPLLRATASMDGSATGIGDVAARVKVNFGQSQRMGAALLADVRFPTGAEEDLLGTGSTQVRVLGLYSLQFGTFSPHLNIGYVARSSEKQNDAVLLAASVDNLLADWATLAVGVETELKMGDVKFALPGDVVLEQPFLRRLPATNIPVRDGDLLRASIGAKFTVREGTVLVLNGLFPLRRVGLQPDVIWTAGLDFPF